MMRSLKWLTDHKLSRIPHISRAVLVVLWVLGIVAFVLLFVVLLRGHTFPLLQTRGDIANRQKDLLIFASVLASLVLIPVYVMLFSFAWRYRKGHKKTYAPDWDSDTKFEVIWWGIPIVVITILGSVTWVTSHSLDPFKPLAGSTPPLRVQVIALQWKWLFIYPEQKVASVNDFVFPAGRPTEFTITSDAPMNSFWIPQLGGQIYAMSGMSTKLNLIANTPGVFQGMSSNISGKDFAEMRFTARAVQTHEFNSWVDKIHSSNTIRGLDWPTYEMLAQPGISKAEVFRLENSSLYDSVIMKYVHTTREKSSQKMSDMEGM